MSKYFKYAVGEILLVVIGILIALQINNWNEENKIDQLRRNKLQQIESDLRLDVANLENSITIKDQEITSLVNLRDRFKNPDFNIDSLNYIVNFEYKGRVTTGFSGFNNTTYNSLVQSGDIGILNDDLVKDLSNLKIHQENTIKSRNDHFSIYLEKIQKFNAQFPSKQRSDIFGEGPLADYLRTTSDNRSFIIGFNEVIIAKVLLYRLLQSYHQYALNMTKSILENHFTTND